MTGTVAFTFNVVAFHAVIFSAGIGPLSGVDATASTSADASSGWPMSLNCGGLRTITASVKDMHAARMRAIFMAKMESERKLKKGRCRRVVVSPPDLPKRGFRFLLSVFSAYETVWNMG